MNESLKTGCHQKCFHRRLYSGSVISIANTQLNNATISGEYITIYQYQRQQQKLNLAEKEQQLQALSRDRAELKTKLNELQAL